MAIEKKGYTDKTAIQNYLLQTIASSFDTQLNEWIAGIEIVIDQITGRNFIADTEETARLYDGDDTSELLIDDAVEITLVEQGADSYGGNFNTIASSGSDRYFTDPNNHTAKGLPIRKLTLSARLWPKGKQNNRVTAKWGYSAEVPADIKFAATVFVAGVLNQNRQGGDQVKSEKIGNYQVTYNTDSGSDSWADFMQAKAILEKYRKLNL